MAAGQTSGGAVDLIWVNGENFAAMKSQGLLFGPLAETLPRPEAQATVKRLCHEATDTGTPLATLAARDFPGLDWADRLATSGLGQAPVEARAYSAAANRAP